MLFKVRIIGSRMFASCILYYLHLIKDINVSLETNVFICTDSYLNQEVNILQINIQMI